MLALHLHPEETVEILEIWLGWYQYSKQLWWCQASSALCSGVGTRAHRRPCGRSCLRPFSQRLNKPPCYLGSCVMFACCWCVVFGCILEQTELLPGLEYRGVQHTWHCSSEHGAHITKCLFLPSLVQQATSW